MAVIRRVLQALRLDKIAAVDLPCQEHATAVIIKRAPLDLNAGQSDAVRMAKGLFDVLRKAGLTASQDDEDAGAETFSDALRDQTITDKFWPVYYTGTAALEASLLSIVKDDTAADKAALITESINQFADYVQGILPGDLGKSISALIAVPVGPAGITLNKGSDMSDELKKALGLPATATEAEVLKAVADQGAALEKSKQEAKDMAAEKEKMKAKDEEEGAVAKALADGSAFRAADGTLILKAAVGDGVFAVLKSQSAQLAKNADDLAKAADREANAVFAKRATDIGQPKEFGAIMRKAYSGDAAAQAEVEQVMKGLTDQVETGALFKNFGHNQTVDGSAHGEIMTKAEVIKAADPKLTDAQAYTKAYTDPANAAIVKRMKVESAA